MNINSKIMYKITNIVCGYLNLDENLLLSGHRSIRITEGKRYISYLAIKAFNIPPNKVAKFFGYSKTRMVNEQVSHISGYYTKGNDLQVVRDIERLEALCNAYDEEDKNSYQTFLYAS